MICPDCRLHLVGHASCELAAERAADWAAVWAAFDDDLSQILEGIDTWQPTGIANALGELPDGAEWTGPEIQPPQG
ncbi:hypothetical protein OG592_27175 [Streptomyces avidinii]|uniref:hypothetical protein n=1 Tax=Streptomyces avidinii TaxID=1895 RepID=UPI003864B1D5|nr:hypothetical protein OG592_27175 [Streptomyces avidinii]